MKKIPWWLMAVVSTLFVGLSFFVVYFIERPEELPFDWSIFALISQINVVVFALPMIYGAGKWLGTKIWILALMGVYAMSIETFAILTSWPYSGFEYGDLIGGKIGIVPWTVAFSWVPILLLGWGWVLPWKSGWVRIGLGAVLMMVFDLVLDPGAAALGFWIWDNPVGWYEIPWMNFFGWIVTSVIGLAIWERLIGDTRPTKPQQQWLMASGVLSLAFWTGVSIWLGFAFPAMIGAYLLGFTIQRVYAR